MHVCWEKLRNLGRKIIKEINAANSAKERRGPNSTLDLHVLQKGKKVVPNIGIKVTLHLHPQIFKFRGCPNRG